MSVPANSLHVSYGPHIRRGRSTAQIMWLVNASLAPALIWATLVFGWQVVAICATSILGCALAEQIACKLSGRASTLGDGSVVCTGLLLAYTLPPAIPLWMPFVGGLLGTFFAKGIFGGLGYNIFNVALIDRAVMMATFPVAMTTAWVAPQLGAILNIDAITGATPLAFINLHGASAGKAISDLPQGMEVITAFLVGLRPGSIGEVSMPLILAGAGFLYWKGIIKLYIPASIIATTFVMGLLTEHPSLYVLSGGLWLGAFYMATDYVTSPVTPRGQIVFGIGIGLLTGIIRNWGGYPEGICYAILLMNIMTPALNDWFRPRRPTADGTPS
jgi:electron transport complex protein RnfD